MTKFLISAKLLGDISHRISLAKGSDPESKDLPFGGVNVLFSGDFGQLRPVNAKSLFSHELVEAISLDTAQSFRGQNNLYGPYLWRKRLTHHVELKTNWRQRQDPRFANLLGRIRLGRAWRGPHQGPPPAGDRNYDCGDYQTLLQRTVDHLSRERGKLEDFDDAPFIVARKNVRDPLNILRTQQFADRTGQTLEYYVSSDSVKKRPVNLTEQKRLWRLNTSVTDDSLGRLPLVNGMKVMIMENIAIGQRVVNGAEGTLVGLKYKTDDAGNRIAECAYVKVPGTGVCVVVR